jgi:RHS repeat-associated protein
MFGACSTTAVAFADTLPVTVANNNQTINVDTATQNNAPTPQSIADKVPAAHRTSTTPSIGKIDTDSAPAPDTTIASKYPAAKDTDYSSAGKNAESFQKGLKDVPDGQKLSSVSESKLYTPHELTNLRTAQSSKYLNADGSITQTNYAAPHYYQESGSWQPIDETLVEDDNASDSGNVFGKALGAVEGMMPAKPNAFKETANSWQARFTPSNFSGGMVRIKEGNSQIGFSPVNAAVVNPDVSKTPDGTQIVKYDNLWPGVSVEYNVKSDQVEEAIILANKDAATQVKFNVIGADLQKPDASNTDSSGAAYNISGALNNDFSISPSELILNNYGPVDSDTSGLTQTYDNGTLTEGISDSYLQSLPDKAFPAVIDPSIQSAFGTRSGGSYTSFEDNPANTCGSNTCDLYGGGLYNSKNQPAQWRGAFFSSYSNPFQNSNVTLTNADLHLTQLTGVSWYTGNTGSYPYAVGHATCLTGYNCIDKYWDSGNISTSGDIDVTNIYQSLISNGDFGGYLMISGTGSNASWKSFDPTYSYVTFTYNYNLAPPSIATPVSGQVFANPQASFAVSTETNPNNSTPLQYEMVVSDGPNQSGTVIDSGTPQNSTLWTVPNGVLEDGSTYYVQARSFDPSTNTYSPYSGSIPFKIDSYNGQSKTQTYDSVGPATVDLANGNLETSIASHTTKALAGDIGLNLSYNSSLKSTTGLIGSYWNVSNGNTGIPTSAPNFQRNDQNVNFNWSGGSSSSGSPYNGVINSTNFAAQWTGYFVAPTTGSYNFGGSHDGALSISVNNNQVYSQSSCTSGQCYGSAVNLTAGQVVPIQISYNHASGSDYAQIYVEGAVSAGPLQTAWLQTGVQPVQSNNGLIGHYFTYTDNGNPPAVPNSGTSGAFLTRTDPLMNFNWNGGSPIPNGPTQDFEAYWSGYVTVPTSGSYTFGTTSDDGSIVTVNGTQVYSKWQDSADTTGLGTAINLTAGQSVPIIVDYYQHQGGDQLTLNVQTPGSSTSQVVPSAWLSSKGQVLPNGWGLGVDPDGSGTYSGLTVNQNNVILTDSSGDTYDYNWNGTAYVPPAGFYGHLVRNVDGSFTLIDSDGTTYSFNSTGTLTNMRSAVDDAHPAALQYNYYPNNGGPVQLQSIVDGVNSSRNMNVYYSGASQCGTIPSGFTAAPANMICAAITNDSRATYFYYDANGNLAEVAKPGNDDTTYQYLQVNNSAGATIGYQLSGIRDDLANDAIIAGTRANDQTTYTNVGYDALGRVTSITEPAATSGATAMGKTYQYLPGISGYQNGVPSTGYFGATQMHVIGATEPVGYTERVEYDNLLRTTADYSIEGQATTTLWNPVKDLEYSTTNPEGQMTSYVYDSDDRQIAQYGPAPSSWFTSSTDAVTGYTDIVPTSSNASKVATNTSAYDQNTSGLAVEYQAVTETSPNQASLTGVPLLHSTNIATNGTISHDWGSTTSPIPNYSGDWGMSMTGKMSVPTTGAWTFSITSDEGVQMWVNNVPVINDWQDNVNGTSPTSSQLVTQTGTYSVATANQLLDVRINYYHIGGDANFSLSMTPPSGSATTAVASYFTPDYSLTTGSTSNDATYGNTTNTTNYGTNPELGLAASSTTDSAGTNLKTSNTYEALGSGYLRQTSQTLPGGSTTSYAYYGASDTATNPCVSGGTAAYQGGMLKTTTSPNGKIVTDVYDDAGNIVATQTNSDGWTCNTYDARSRVVKQVVPAFNGSAARTVTYNYNVNSNPLVISETDSTGTITTTGDLLGRAVSYTDANGDTTTSAYDNLGRMTSQTSGMGTETYTYNNYNQITDEKLGSNDLAWPAYDQYGRLVSVSYPSAGALGTTINYDPTTGTEISENYNLSAATPGSNLISNPSFENHTVNSSLPDNWLQDNYGTNTATFSYPSNGHTGSYSGRIDMTSYTNGDAKWDEAPVNVTASTNYTVSDYYESNVATTVDAKITNSDGSVTYQYLGTPAATAANTWTKMSYNFTTTSNATQVTILHTISAVGYLQTDDMALQSNPSPLSISDTDTLTQSGKIQQDAISNGSATTTSAYTYDTADRLTAATIGSNSYSYGYGTQNSSCGTGSSTNPNSGMDGNRTTQTINSATTTYCYNNADQLTSSSDPTANGDTYDAHGNLTQIGTGSAPVQFQYDSTDRPVGMQQFTSSGNGYGIYDSKDVSDRIISRTEDTITGYNWSDSGDYHYFYTDSGSSPAYVRNNAWTITEEYLQLPGGVTQTIYPAKTGASASSYDLPNLHGDTLLIANAYGVNTSTGTGASSTFIYDPFGNPLPGAANPANSDAASFGYEGKNMKFTETAITLNPIQMGARIYLPTIGRFTSMDPVAGANPNAYTYVLDPINDSDITGAFPWSLVMNIGFVAVQFVPAADVVADAGVAADAGVDAATDIAERAAIRAGSKGGETAGKTFSQSVKNDVLNSESKCAYCNMEPKNPEVDHIIPKSRGGNASRENAQLTCRHCNRSKGAGDFPKTPPAGYRGRWKW